MAGRSRVVAALLAVTVLGACTGTSSTRTSTGSPTGAAPGVPDEARSLPGSLLVLDGSGSLITMRPDGTDRTTLAIAEEDSLAVLQAAWSPDGSKVAWAQVDLREGTAVPRLVTSGPQGEERVETRIDLAPFYLAWDPTSHHVAYLGNRDDGIGLGIVEGATSATASARPLDEGSPYYFSWAPDGERMLVHVGEDRLDELTIEGEASPVGRRPGSFQAPAWSSDGSTQVFVQRYRGPRQRIMSIDAGGSRAQAVTTAEGAVFMVLSPDGTRLAYQALSPGEFNIYDPGLPSRATNVGVSVVDLTTGEVERASTSVAHAWFWSPDGSHLAILEPVYAEAGSISFLWRLWDGESSFETDEVNPAEALLRTYTPFFSQFAQSSTVWSPDGSAIAFPVEGPGGAAILVQP
ncbi:MAG: TolB family protein, partial [Actinomycetota bacterium]